MSVSVYIHRKLVDLLEERRVVVWYDSEKAFCEWANRFVAPNCIVFDTSKSILESRRQADRICIGLNDADDSEFRHKHLLVYCPQSRGKTEEDRYQDPFEVFAVIGAAFGDKEAETLQSLARQSMPERAAEIDRLFEEGRPTLAMLDNLKAGDSYPLINDCLGTEAPLDVVAKLLCVKGTVAKVADTPGVIDELQRMFHKEFGYTPPARVTKVESKLEPLGSFVLLSEFAFDLATPLPDALANLPLAPPEHKLRIFALCDRMRRSDDFREGYLALAQRHENELRLKVQFVGHEKLGERDTFPFEERHYLQQIPTLAEAAKLAEARAVITARRNSVWSALGDRAVLWKVAERCIEFLIAAQDSQSRLVDGSRPLKEHLAAYVDREIGLWRVDQRQRLVEQGSADCAEHDEIEPLFELCRRRYLEIVGKAQENFQQALERECWPPEGANRQTQIFDRHVAPELQEGRRVAYFLVDSMRFEMGCDLVTGLAGNGSATVESVVSILPTVTPFGMAALLPGADASWKIVRKGDDLIPSVGDQPLAGVKDRIALLKARFGDRYADTTLEQVLSIKEKRPPKQIAGADLLVVRTQEMDSYGEAMNLYQARKHMSGILGELVTATNRLAKLGFTAFVFAADHGHVLLPEIPSGDAIRKPPGEWPMEKRRSLLGHSTGPAAGVLILKTDKLGIEAPVPEMAVAKGFRVFTAGAGYFHEGLSLQECVLPVVILTAPPNTEDGQGSTDVAIRYRSDSFTSRVIGLKVFYNSLFDEPLVIRLEAYDGSGPKAKLVGEAADCDARDPTTGHISLKRGKETQIPLRLDDNFEGDKIEVRAIEATGPGVILDRKQLKNNIMM
jgi:hypothetical protein